MLRAYSGAVADVFLSYARADLAVAERLAAALEASGFSVWWDRQITGGSSFSDAIEEALNEAGKVIVLWLKESVKSSWVRDEACAARDQGKLVPMSIDGTLPPMGFRQIQSIELGNWIHHHAREVPPDLKRALAFTSGTATPVSGRKAALIRPRLMIIAAAIAALVLTGLAYFVLDKGWTVTSSPEASRIPLVVHQLTVSGSTDSRKAGLAQGITDELIARLRSVPELQIATAEADGTVASAAFKNAYDFSGNIQSEGQQLRVVARLARPDGTILWSQTFERELVDLFDVQEAIASAVARVLSVSLDVGSHAAENGGTRNPEAFAAYMQYWPHLTDADTSVPLGYLRRAVELDPGYVRAHVAIANQNSILLVASPGLDKAGAELLLEEMDEGSAKAIKAVPNLPAGHSARAWYYLSRKDLPKAVAEIEKVAALDRGDDPEVRAYQANFGEFLGRARKSLALSKSAELIDPIERNNPERLYHLLMAGEYQQCSDLYDRLVRIPDINLQSYGAHAGMAKILLGKRSEGMAVLATGQSAMGSLDKLAEQKELVGKSIAELRQWADRQFGAGGQLFIAARAAMEAYVGRNELALDLMRVAMERPGGIGMFFFWYPTMAEARKLPAFKSLVESLDLPEVWRKSGDWGDFCRPVGQTDFECF